MFGLTTTRRLRAELAAAHAETDRQRERAEKAEKNTATAVFNRQQVLRTNAGLDEQLTAALIANTCLTEDLTAVREELAEARAQVTDGAVAEWRAQAKAEKRRADGLQKRLDDACGLNTAAVGDGSRWQERRDDKRTPRVKEAQP